MDVTTIGDNALLFANLPTANKVPAGRVYRVSDIGPAPGIELIATGTQWRPRGGSQMLASIRNAPVIQNLSVTNIVTLGPFPGGLVRAGMGLATDAQWDLSGLGTAARRGYILIGGTPQLNSTLQNSIITIYNVSSFARIGFRAASQFNALNDGSGPHPTGMTAQVPFGLSADQYSTLFLSVDLSQPWYITAVGHSAAETPVAISGATWAAGVITFTTAAAHTLAVGDKTTIAGVTPADYNGVYIVLSVPNTTTFTVAHVTDPGAYTLDGNSSRISNVILRSLTVKLES